MQHSGGDVDNESGNGGVWVYMRVEGKWEISIPSSVFKNLKLPKGNQSWIFIGRTDAEAETPVLWPPDSKNWLTGKDPDAEKDWRQEEKGTTEEEMVGWHHWLNEHEFEQALGDGEGQGSLVSCSPWGHKESDRTEQQQSIMSLFLCMVLGSVVVSFFYIWLSTFLSTTYWRFVFPPLHISVSFVID